MNSQKKQFHHKTVIIPVYVGFLLLLGMIFIYIFEEIGFTNRELNLDMRSDTMIKLTSRAIKYHKENNTLNWLVSNDEKSNNYPSNIGENFLNNEIFFEEQINKEKFEKVDKINNILLDAIDLHEI